MKRLLYALAVFTLLGAGCAAPASNTSVQAPSTAITTTAAQPSATPAPSVNALPPEPKDSSLAHLYKVTKVVDGDTIDVDIDGKVERIRLIGINTPEIVDPRKPVECFGKEASDRAKKLLGGQKVKLEADPTQTDRDKYARLLRYVILTDGTNVNLQMIRDGYAYEYTYQIPYKFQAEFKAAETEAKAAKRGLWADGVCEAPSVTQPVTTQTTTPTPVLTTPAPTPAPPPASSTSSCDCSGNIYNCGDFTTHAAAQALYDCCTAKVGSDIHRLDGNDNDGLACESLP
jgi:micrococcal nuclease